MPIENGTVANANKTDIYTSSNDSAITCVFLCNTGSADEILNVYVYNSSSTTESQIVKELTVPGKDTYTFNVEKLAMSNGDKLTIQKSSSSQSMDYTISYLGI